MPLLIYLYAMLFTSIFIFYLFIFLSILATNALWNNMFEPVGNKSMTWKKQFEHFNCPTLNNPYICTNKNCGRQGYDEKENETDT